MEVVSVGGLFLSERLSAIGVKRTSECSQELIGEKPGRFLRANDVRSASSALLHVAHVQPVCKAASAIALLRQHDAKHAREEHARHKRGRCGPADDAIVARVRDCRGQLVYGPTPERPGIKRRASGSGIVRLSASIPANTGVPTARRAVSDAPVARVPLFIRRSTSSIEYSFFRVSGRSS